MFQQDWSRTVNWCNPPFALIPRVISLLQAQRASAVMLAPMGRKAVWARQLTIDAPGVRKLWRFDPPRGPAGHIYYAGYAILLFDFSSHPPRSTFDDLPSAESFDLRTAAAPRFLPRWPHP